MATNDYRSYMRATEEYRHSDTLHHAGKKGMKWGISHTPGYKAIGQKAKGILDAMGNYIYNTYNKLTSKSTSAPSTTAGFNAVKLAEIAEQRKAEARKADEELKKKEEEPKMEVRVQEFHRPTPTEGPKEPQKDDLKEDEHGKYRIVDGEKHYDLGDGKEYLYADGTFFEVGGTGKTVPEGKTPEPAKPGEREPSDDMVDDDGNLKLLDQHGPYFDADGEKHYDLGDGKAYLYSDGLYFPIGGGEPLQLIWDAEKFRYVPIEIEHSEEGIHYIGEILDSDQNDLTHWGILGMKWGVRRYQNEDGSLTPEGRERYLKGNRLTDEGKKELTKSFNDTCNKLKSKQKWVDMNSFIKSSPVAKEIGTDMDEEFKKELSTDPEKEELINKFSSVYDQNNREYAATAAILNMRDDSIDYTMKNLAYEAGWYIYDDGDQGQNNSRAVCAYLNGLDPLKVEDAGDFAADCYEKAVERTVKKYSNINSDFTKQAMRFHSKALDTAYCAYETSERLTNKESIKKAQTLAKQIAYCFRGDYWTTDVEKAIDALNFSNKSPDEMTKNDWNKLHSYLDQHSSEVKQMDSDQNELYHEGRGHLDGGRSGRYPWGSGADPYQRSELGSARAAAENVLNRAGNMPADKFLNNGILDVSTVANNAVDNGRPLTSKNNQMNAAAGAAYSLAANPSWENAAKVVPKAIVDSGTRGWTEHDFDGIPTEIIKRSNERSAAIKAYKGYHGDSTPVSDGAAKAAKVASLGLTAIAFIKLVEGMKGKSGS